ncbi:MAG: hypothetical protein ACRYGA_00565 [Janthinobacterium lividum]
MLHDPFNRSQLPADFGREDRVRLLGQLFADLLAGRAPSREAAVFLGGAGLAWLQQGGSLEKDYLRVVKPKSRHTAAFLWQQYQAEAHSDEGHQERE